MQEKIGIGFRIWSVFEFILKIVICSILRIKITDEKWNQFMQFVKFGVVGVSNTMISYVIYLIFLFTLGEAYYLVGNAVGFFVSVLNSFYWNDKYVFKKNAGENRSKFKALIKVILSYASTGLVLSSILISIFFNIFHIPKTFCPLVALLITIPLNYIMNKVWAFKDGK